MLPLFGRTVKKPSPSIGFNDEWLIPTDQEIFGGSSRSDETILETLNEVSNENVINSPSLSNEMRSLQSISDMSVIVDGIDESEEIISNITTNTFAIMNNETTIVNSMEELELIENDELKMVSFDLNAVLSRIKELERKCDELGMKIAKIEKILSEKGNSEFNATMFVNEFGCMIQDLMKNGLAFQQGIIGKLIDELDGIFDFDAKNFDPFK